MNTLCWQLQKPKVNCVMKIYTKTGDKGTTALIGGMRVPKYNLRLETYGTIDELMSFIGLLHDQPEIDDRTRATLITIQSRLMDCASIYATDESTKKTIPQINGSDIELLEKEIDLIDRQLEPLRAFVLPGGHQVVSLCHVCRTICRRTERLAVKLATEIEIPLNANIYINRLSDYFFALSRIMAKKLNIEQIVWQPNK